MGGGENIIPDEEYLPMAKILSSKFCEDVTYFKGQFVEHNGKYYETKKEYKGKFDELFFKEII